MARYGRAVDVCGCSVHGGASRAEQAASLSAGVDIIVATPGRLMDLLALHEGMQVGVTSPASPSRQTSGTAVQHAQHAQPPRHRACA